MDWLLLIITWNWFLPLVFAWAYCGLWWRLGDLEFEGWIFWRGWFPVARWRLTDRKSWFHRMWRRFYGMSLLFGIIHRDEPGKHDDAFVEKTIVHEMRHVAQGLCGGLLFYAHYGADVLCRGYWNCWAERNARKAADDWERNGCPRVFAFGVRR